MTLLALSNQKNHACLTLIDGVASSLLVQLLWGPGRIKSACTLLKEEPEGEYSECSNRKKKKRKKENRASLLKAVKCNFHSVTYLFK